MASVLLTLVAELLIVAGAGTGLYVLWTAWWTDVVAVREQTQILDGLRQPETPDRAGVPQRGPAPVLDEPTAVGAVFGSMQIPRFGNDYDRPIAQGTDRERVLNTIGLGHYVGVAMPGAVGNFAVAGHRVTYGKPLNQVAELQTDDAVVVRVTDTRTAFDVWYVYRVTDSQIVTPEHTETIAPVPNEPGVEPGADDRWLTLTACHPMWSAAERYVVHAKLDYWMQASDGTPKELREAAK
ncbi:class E sortase [Curtobacterium sp. MCBD17_032]|nr:class E sortase [Curtobacterium sp. MCBD17_032]